MGSDFTYKSSGVDIDAAMEAKRRMSSVVDSGDDRVLNSLGAFASLVKGSFPGIDDPVLTLKMEEPGSKQLLAVDNDRVEGLGRDLINHLIDDIAVMGAEPVAVLDTIVCGQLQGDVVVRLVESMAAACKEHGCPLVGGETSEQPGVLKEGRYVLSAAVIGVVDRKHIIDGGRIEPGDVLVGIASNGLHTNGYSLVRKLLSANPGLGNERVDGESFLDVVLRPHTAYLPGLRGLFREDGLTGLAHITGGGIHDNLARIIPEGRCAEVDLSALRVPSVFKKIREVASLDDAEMLKTFNMGIGVVAVARAAFADRVVAHLGEHGHEAYPIGRVVATGNGVSFTGRPNG